MAKLRKDHAALNASGRCTAKRAAELCGASVSTMAKWRKKDIGPSWRREHKKLVSYDMAECVAFATSGQLKALLGSGGRKSAVEEMLR